MSSGRLRCDTNSIGFVTVTCPHSAHDLGGTTAIHRGYLGHLCFVLLWQGGIYLGKERHAALKGGGKA